MEARMVRRTDRPLLRVRVSFETTRFSQQHLIEVYARLTPTLRRALRSKDEDARAPAPPEIARRSGSKP
jgi:hypothetical protein